MKYFLLIFLLTITSSASLAQDAVDDGQIDLSPLLSEPPTVPSDDDPLQTPSTDDETQPPAALPRYFRADAGSDVATPQGDTANTETDQPSLAINAMGSGIHRLSGEYDEIAVHLNVPTGGTVDDLIITYRNSINVLAETSAITVLQEGVEIAAWQPDAPAEFQQVTLPGNTLTPGLNRIVIRAEQSHRIFCGPEASFEIWTDIDLARSGIKVASGNGGMPGMDDFRRAASAQIAANGTLPVVAVDPPTTTLMRDLQRRIAALAFGGPAELSLQSPYAVTADAETADTLTTGARIAVVQSSDVAGDAALPQVRQSPQGDLVLVISADTTADLLDALLPLPAAISVPPDLIPGDGATLTALRADGITIRSRYRRVDVPFHLPDDWLLLSSQRGQIDLQYRYAENLPNGSLFLIKVNDTTVRLLPLFGEGGLVLPELPVGFSARLLKPGYNTISFEAIIPGDPVDLPCPKIEGPMLEISENSVVNVPTSPRMQFPSLSQGLQRLTPGSVALVTNLAGNNRAEEILTMLSVHLVALNNERVGTDMARLTVSTLAGINQVPLELVSLDRSSLESALTPEIADPPEQAANLAVAEDRFAPPSEPTESYGDRIRKGIGLAWQGVRRLAWPGDPPLVDWISGRHGQALLLMPDPAAPLDLWLIVGAFADPGDVARALAAGRLDTFGPDGQAALLSADGTWQSWNPAATPPDLREPLTIANARAVAGNYASWSPVWFVGLLAGFMSISVLLGLSFVVTTRGTRKR